jgi:hypothetical protein
VTRRRLALLAAGPTAALVYGAVSCARAGRWWMAAVYVAGAVEVYAVLPPMVGWLARAALR